MRCDVLGNRDFENSVDDDGSHLNTDIQVWRENTEQQRQQQQQQQQQKHRSISVVPCESRGLARMYPADKSCAIAGGGAMTNLQRYCRRDDEMHNHRLARPSYHNEIAGPDNKSSACDGEEDEDEDDEDVEDEEENLVEAALPAVDKKQRRRGPHLRKLKSNCKPEELQKLKTQCEVSLLAPPHVTRVIYVS